MTNTTPTPKAQTGIRLVDEQNKVLFNLINQYTNVAIDNQHPAIISTYLEQLINDIKFHFYNEEQNMLAHNYPNIKTHRQSHDKIVNRLLTFTKMQKMGIKDMGRITVSFLHDWIRSHIRESDIPFSIYLKMKEKTDKQPLKQDSNIIYIAPVFNKSGSIEKYAKL